MAGSGEAASLHCNKEYKNAQREGNPHVTRSEVAQHTTVVSSCSKINSIFDGAAGFI